jgi:hypothetical protein
MSEAAIRELSASFRGGLVASGGAAYRTIAATGDLVARRVVEALGESIRVERLEGEGARVEMDMPAAVPVSRWAK